MNEYAATTVWYLPALTWWPFVVLVGLLALPLATRMFRGLADRGGSISSAVGLAFILCASWIPAVRDPDFSSGRNLLRLICLLAAVSFTVRAAMAVKAHPLLSREPRWRMSVWWPATLFLVLAVLPLNHTAAGIWFAVLLLLITSVSSLLEAPDRTRSSLRRAAVPFAISQVIALTGFVAFCHIRSFIPWVHYGPEYSGAEKFSNFMHLASAMRATTLPPADAWFSGLPTNYYYGGHLLVATIAKATGTGPGHAFNLGLATMFALTLSGGFGLSLNLLNLTSSAKRFRNLALPSSIDWAVLGTLAVGVFGNVDALIQFHESGWSLTALERFDYWRSSRVIHSAPDSISQPGTITEFPFFSAILGDLHPHHMAVPFALIVLHTMVNLHRLSVRSTTWRQWLQRCSGSLVLLGGALGLVFPVNIWDSVVFGPTALFVLWFSVRHIEWPEALTRPARFALVFVPALWATSLIWNSSSGSITLFGSVAGFIASSLLALSAATLQRHATALLPVLLAGSGILAFAGGFSTGRGLSEDASLKLAVAIACRDAAVFSSILFLVWRSAFSPAYKSERLPATLLLWGIAGFFALVVTMVFLPWFSSPLKSANPVFISFFPPIPDPALFTSPAGFFNELKQRCTVTTFPNGLRTHPEELFTYWGIFLVPLIILFSYRLGGLAVRCRIDVLLGFAGFLLAINVLSRNMLETWTVGLAVVWITGCLVLAWNRARFSDGSLWPLLAAAGTAVIFVETLHFDDSYAGYLERYNTPFKILYPIWPILAVGMVLSLKTMTERIASLLRMPVPLRTGTGILLSAPFLAAGLLYPFSATMVRTRGFGTLEARNTLERNHPRSLDATEWMLHTGDKNRSDDHAMAQWLRTNALPGEHVLECPPSREAESYSIHGRIAAFSGVPAPIGWPHHQRQWRGWNRTLSEPAALYFAPLLPPELYGISRLPADIATVMSSQSDRLALGILAIMPQSKRAANIHLHFPGLDEEQRMTLSRHFDQSKAGPPTMLQLSEHLISDMREIYRAPTWTNDLLALLRLHRIRYIVVGELERSQFKNEIEKFSVLDLAFQSGDSSIYYLPDDFVPPEMKP